MSTAPSQTFSDALDVIPESLTGETAYTNSLSQPIIFQRSSTARHPDFSVRVKSGDALVLETEGIRLTATGDAVKHRGTYSVTTLTSHELPPMPQGMVNMTAGVAGNAAGGYRLLPSGDHFDPPAELRVDYDPALLPPGYTADDIYTSYYDSASMSWVRLERVGIDTARHEIVSLTGHFTDFVNELLKAPDMPETQAFVPTAMSSLEAAHPMEGITLMQPPTANNDGTVSLSYPLDLPPGRGGMQPSLALTYSSGGGGGWLGEGWDIPIPSITIDTRWGVPRYDRYKESEVYMYKGEQLVATDEDGKPLPHPHRTKDWNPRLPDGTRFVPRVNEAFDSIVRHGTRPSDYWWEVYDRGGVVHRYGRYETLGNDTSRSTLGDNRGNIARWCLTESEDAYGNMVRYLYDTVQYSGIANSIVKGVQIYPAEIHYTLHRNAHGHVDDTGFHRVVFHREDDDRTRRHSHKVYTSGDHGNSRIAQFIPSAISCRNGFKEVTASLLSHLQVFSGDTMGTVYYFGMAMDRGTNFKVILKNVFLVKRDNTFGMGEKGVYYRGEDYGNCLNFDYVQFGEDDDIFGPAVKMHDDPRWGEYSGDVNGVGFISDAEMVLGCPISPTALGMSKGFNWNVGGGVSVGLGFNVFWTTLSAGGNYSYSHSSDKGSLTLTDLDGDGLSDKVYRDMLGRVWYRKHIPTSGGRFIYGTPVRLSSIDNFQKTTGHSHDVGLQVSLGLSATASRNWGKSYTTTYFSDVNADGLPDLVTDEGVYFNDLVDGVPTFSLTPHHTEPDTPDTVRTSTMPCGYIIYDGELNDSIYCATVWREKAVFYSSQHDLDSGIHIDFLDSGYVIDNIHELKVVGSRFFLDCGSRSYRTGGADGIGGWGVDPQMEAVKVWVAPDSGIVTVSDTIRMLPDRTGGLQRSRYADGVAFSVQLCRDVRDTLSNTGLACTSESRIPALSGTLDRYDTLSTVRGSTFRVSKGDILFFRLQSGQSRLFDRVDWRHGIRYGDRPGTLDDFGKPANRYVSSEDYVIEGRDFFQAPAAGILMLDMDCETGTLQNSGTHNAVKIHVQFNDYEYDFILPENSTRTISGVIPGGTGGYMHVNQGDSVKVWLTTDDDGIHTTWGNVEVIPHYHFIPDTDSAVTDELDWWLAPDIPDLRTLLDTAYHNLFGVLYRGWGQFSYMADSTQPGDMIHLADLRCGKPVYGISDDTTGDNNPRRHIHQTSAVEISFGDISSAVTASGNYNPLSTGEGRWRRMDPDCRHQAWLGYGRTTAITRTMETNVCPQEFFAAGEAAGTYYMDCPATAPTAIYPKVKTHARYSESRTDNVAVSADFGITVGGSYSKGYSNTLADYTDLNGDRYPDLVGEGAVQLTMPYGGLEDHVRDILGQASETGTVSGGASVSPGENPQSPGPMFGKVNLKAKMESVPDRPASGSGGVTTGADTARFTLADINGDGLPDRIYSDGRVALNVGYSFLSPEPWNCQGSHRGTYRSCSGSASTRLPFNIQKFSVGGGISIGMSDNRTLFQLMDINGDGLPDRVVRNTNNTLTAYINLGGGRWHKVSVNAGEISHGASFNESVNLSVTAGFTAAYAKVTGTVSGTPLGRNFSAESVQIMDIDGDGFPDYVTSNAEDKMTVRYSTLGRVNQLVRVHNRNDASFTMDYNFMTPTYEQPQGQWVLSSCRVSGMPSRGIPESYTTYEYKHPHYDRFERMSYGYDTVISCQHTLNSSGNHIPYRYVTEGYHNSSYQKRGKRRSESVSGVNGRRWDETLYDIRVVDMESGDTVGDSDCPLVSYPLLETTVVNHYEGQTAPQMTTAKSFIYDNRRNVVTYFNRGDTNRTGDELCAHISYLTGRARNQISLRGGVTVRGGRQPSAPVIRSGLFAYDTKGGLVQRTDSIDGVNDAVTDYQRDAYGNVTMVTLPGNATGQRMWYSYTYDPVLHALPIATDDAYGRHSSATYSYLHGKPLSITDAAGNTMRYTYDLWGRTLTVTAPRELAAGIPYTWKAEYDIFHNATHTSHYDTLHPGNPIETYTICDPWGHIVQVKKDIVVNGTGRVQVSGKTEYDALGRAVRQHDPLSMDFDSLLLYRRTPSALRTVTGYDILDRTVSCSTYHGGIPLVQTTAYTYAATATGTLLQTSVTDPMNRTTTSLTDALGRTVSVIDAVGGTTQFSHDALGQLLASTDPDGFLTTYAYDLLGRQTGRSHPDAGTTTNTYDPAGNLLTQTNAAGETVAYEYEYMRPTVKHYSKFPMNNVTYHYNPAGQVSRIKDGSGVHGFSYDKLGNVSRDTHTIAVPYSGHTYTFAMEYEYDSWGRMLSMTYPDGEVVTYGYDLGGSLSSMSGMKSGVPYSYISSVLYDRFGNRSMIRYGNQSVTEYTYDDLQRLTRLRTTAYNSGTPSLVQDIAYTFDGVGNITDAANTAPAFGTLGGPYANHYVYDDIDRLTESFQSYGTGNTLAASYSASGRLCGRSQTSNGQDALFGYDKGDKPHAPRRILNSNYHTMDDLLWDMNGNLAQVSTHSSLDGGFLHSRHLFWTEDSRLSGVADGQYLSYYAYGHDGERVLKMTGTNNMVDVNAVTINYSAVVDNVTLYTSPYLVAGNSGYTKHYYAGTERVCARIGNGGLNHGGGFIGSNAEIEVAARNLFDSTLSQMQRRCLAPNNPSHVTAACSNAPAQQTALLAMPLEPIPTMIKAKAIVSTDNFNSAMLQYAALTQQNEDAYFYHGDHLGSASWVTDGNGIPVQHLQYLPFGEPFINQRASGSTYNERFTFTGKERDEETGYSYFGARFYDSDLSGLFLSVDPMADKYPSISPYAYCAWNPLRLIDPNGDSIAVLIAEKAVYGEGHMAILVQADDGEWQLWSKNGEGKSSSEDKSASNNDKPYGTTFKSVQDFLDNHKANSEGHNGSAEPYYTEAYVIPTTKKQDKTIREKMATFMSSYHLLTDNCADAVKKSLKAAGITTEKDPMMGMSNTAKAFSYSAPGFLFTKHMTEDVIPATIYRNIKEANPDGTVCKPRMRK